MSGTISDMKFYSVRLNSHSFYRRFIFVICISIYLLVSNTILISQTQQKTKGELRCSGRVCSSYSTSGIHRAVLLFNDTDNKSRILISITANS